MKYIYAILLLHKLKKEINEETLTKVIVATGIKIDKAKIKCLIISLRGIDMDNELKNVGEIKVAPIIEKPKEEIMEKTEEKKSATEGLWDLFG